MNLKLTKKSIWKYFFYLFILLFPILPEYFRIANVPVHEILSLLIFIIAFWAGVSKKKFYFCVKWMTPILILSALSYGYFGELSSFLAYILPSVISMSVIIFYVDSRKDVDRILDLVIYAGFFICLAGLIEKISGFNVFSLIETVQIGIMGTTPTVRDGVARVEASFGSPITLGVYLVFINMVINYRLRGDSKKGSKVIYYVTYILTFVISYWTDSRMAMITLILLQVLLFLRNRWDKKIILLFGVLLVILFDFLTGQLIWQFLSNYLTLITDIVFYSGGTVDDTTTAYRLMLIPTLLPYAKEHLLFGYGNTVMEEFTFSIWGHTYYSIDNGFLSELMWHGLIGLVKMLLPLIYGFRFAIKRLKKDKYTGYGFICLFAMYTINLFSVAQMSEKRILFLMVALIMSFDFIKDKNEVIE